jgi:hypothetical protein
VGADIKFGVLHRSFLHCSVVDLFFDLILSEETPFVRDFLTKNLSGEKIMRDLWMRI